MSERYAYQRFAGHSQNILNLQAAVQMFRLSLFWGLAIPRGMVTKPQNNAPHILIIGAGLIGLSTADALQRRGAKVTITEARPKPMRGTSYSNSGMVHPSQARPWGAALSSVPDDPDFERASKAVFDLARMSQDLLRQNIQDLSKTDALSQDVLSQSGSCYQIFEQSEPAYAAKEKYEALGVQTALMSDHEKTLGYLALHFPDDFGANALTYGQALAARLAENGAVFIYDAGDLRLRMGRSPSGGEAVTAQLRGHIFHADHIIICAGPQSGEVLSQLDIVLPLVNKRGFAVNFDKPDMVLPQAPIMDAQTHSALTVLGETLRFSGTLGEQSAHPLLKRWYHLVPDIMRRLAPAREVWSGLRPLSPVGRPYIGPLSRSNLWVNTGHGHMGWTLCAGSGALMADMVLEGVEDARFALSE